MRNRFSKMLALAGAAALAAPLAIAQSFPSKPVLMIVPFPGGSTTDTFARLIAAGMEPALGQRVLVEPRPGGGTVVGTQYVMAQPPDGHTILLTTIAAAIKSAVVKPPFDIRKDLAAIAEWNNSPLYLAVNTKHPFKTAKELVDYAKANPGKLNMSSYGVGTVGHLMAELLMYKAGTKAVHVPFQGSVNNSLALAQGNGDFTFDVTSSLKPHVDAGRVRILAVGTATRDAGAPEIPSMVESGVPDFDVGAWSGYMAPLGTPRDVIMKLNAALVNARNDKAVIDHFAKIRINLNPKVGSPEQFQVTVARTIDDFQKLIRDAKLEVE
jgi:tripartite-type tricarboxylate transporter receptor subunit TctC